MLVGAVATGSAHADRRKPDTTVTTAPAKADEPEPPAPPAGPDDAKARAILDRIVAGPNTAARQAAITELTAIAPKAIDAVGAFVMRPHGVSVEDRTQVLAAIKAAVPDKAGRFIQPERKTAKEDQADDDFDWLAALLALDPATPGVGEVIADVAALRALSATMDIHAAQLVFDTSFGAETMIYRDSPAATARDRGGRHPRADRESLTGDDYDRKRCATYQLERIDHQEPGKALAPVGR